MKASIALLVLLLLLQTNTKAQMKVGDNPTTINNASLLELETTNKGFVPPRVALTSLTSPSPLPAGLITGTIVFNTNNGISTGIGIYFWDGTAWIPIIGNIVGSTSAWTLTGNAGINAANNFVGTTDGQPLIFRTNNVERMRVLSTGNVGIGTTTPPNALSVLATNPLYLSGLQALTSVTSTDSVLTINAGVVKKAPSSLFSGGSGGSGWLLTGNANTQSSTNFVGTTDDRALVFRVNNTTAGFLGGQNDGQGRTSFGYSATASDQYSTAIGREAQASAQTATSLGYQAKATSQYSVALGTGATAGGTSAVAVGRNASGTAQSGIAIGNGAAATANIDNIAIGTNAAASVQQGVAIGPYAKANQNLTAMALGYTAIASGQSSTAIGDHATASGQNSLAFGVNASASGVGAIAMGNGALSSVGNTTSFGSGAQATAIGANAFGNLAVASGVNSLVVGNSASTTGVSSIIIGDNSGSTANNIIIIGNGLTTAQADAFILGNTANKIGLGTTAPAYKLHIMPATGVEPLYLGGVQQITSYTSTDSVLTIRNGVVKKFKAILPQSDPVPSWYTSGNSGTVSSDFLGTTDNKSLRIRTNNIQRMLIDSIGSVAIGTSTFDSEDRERLLVDYGTTTSNTVANFKGSINSYLQINVQNSNGGNNASSDFVATANDGTDSTFYIDMGINGSGFGPSVENWGNAHDAYLYSNSRHLLIGTQASASDLIFLLGGGNVKDNAVLRINGPSGNIIVGRGDATAAPDGNIIRGPRGSGTNVAGGNLTLQGGGAINSGTGGSLNLYGGTSGSGVSGSVNIRANPLTITGVQQTTTFSTDSILTISNGTVKKAPYSSLPLNGATKNNQSFASAVNNITVPAGAGNFAEATIRIPTSLVTQQASVAASPSFDLPPGIVIAFARVISTNQLKIRLMNTTASAQTVNGSFYFTVTEL